MGEAGQAPNGQEVGEQDECPIDKNFRRRRLSLVAPLDGGRSL
ncbi:MAG: hypothetical protein RBU37_19110 [Myxococcota bacterium]|nr:hypothetical protein [Myxococcota bacterium]